MLDKVLESDETYLELTEKVMNKIIDGNNDTDIYLGIRPSDFILGTKDDYDILHINTWFVKSYFVAKKAKRKGKKIVYHAHSTEEDYKNGFILAKQTSKLIKWWLIKCYSLGDIIVTPTLYSKKLLHGYKGLENKKIYALPIDFSVRQ